MEKEQKIEFYHEVVEKVLRWSSQWNYYHKSHGMGGSMPSIVVDNKEPKSTQDFVNELIEFENNFENGKK